VKAKIHLETMSDVHRFVKIATAQRGNVHITDGAGLKVSAKSILGALYALEFDELWCEADEDIYHAIENFVTIE
jgi:hypothetical protein